MFALLKKLVFPVGKLPVNFPWTVQTAGKKYLGALRQFIIGSVLAPGVVVAVTFFLAAYPAMLDYLKEPASAACFLGATALAAAFMGFLLDAWRCYSQGVTKLARRLTAAVPWYLLGGAIAAALLNCLIVALSPYHLNLMLWAGNLMTDGAGKPSITFVMVVSLLSFVMGFGMQVRYIARELRNEGISLAKAMALTIEPLKGKWWGATLFNIVLPVVVAYVLSQLFGEAIIYFMGAAHQPTVDLAKQATGGNMWMFGLMAAVGAPIFEEIVFRGFMFNVIRCSLTRDAKPLVLKEVPAQGVTRLWVVLCNRVASFMHPLFARLHGIMGGKRAEFTAVIISSLLFSLMHMQFQPTTMVLLFMMGCVQAELYRRSGSLYCAMLLHAVNNGIEVLKLACGQA